MLTFVFNFTCVILCSFSYTYTLSLRLCRFQIPQNLGLPLEPVTNLCPVESEEKGYVQLQTHILYNVVLLFPLPLNLDEDMVVDNQFWAYGWKLHPRGLKNTKSEGCGIPGWSWGVGLPTHTEPPVCSGLL